MPKLAAHVMTSKVDQLKAEGRLDIDYARLWEILQSDDCFELYSPSEEVCLRTWDDKPIMVAEISTSGEDIIDVEYCRAPEDLPRLVYDFIALGGDIDELTARINSYEGQVLVPIYSS